MYRPAQEWIFINPVDDNIGFITAVGIDRDPCEVGTRVEYEQPSIALPLGGLAVRNFRKIT